jgi:hypothetical protein
MQFTIHTYEDAICSLAYQLIGHIANTPDSTKKPAINRKLKNQGYLLEVDLKPID